MLNGLALGQHHQHNGGNCLQAGGGQGRPPSSTDSFTSSSTTFNKDEQQKKAKIREALEKMKEAKMKKVKGKNKYFSLPQVFVKIFLEDGSQRGLLVDERWSVAETMRQLSEKLNCALTPEHAIVEEYPHLHISKFCQIAITFIWVLGNEEDLVLPSHDFCLCRPWFPSSFSGNKQTDREQQ